MSRQDMKNTGDKTAHKIDSLVSKRLYTLKESAHYLGRPVFSLRSLLWSGKLPYIQDGRKYYLDIKDLDEYIDREKQRCI
jgi:excisionase family DNA binding protein